jgi:hypothetical protein
MNQFWAEVLIELLPTNKGGRKEPFDLCNDRPGEYRPQLRVIGGSGEMLGVAFMDGPDDPIPPGGKTLRLSTQIYHTVNWLRATHIWGIAVSPGLKTDVENARLNDRKHYGGYLE